MTDTALEVEILVLPVDEWLTRELPGWATRARFHARRLESYSLLVLTATSTFGDVGYAVFDQQMSHLHYLETREDQRRRGIANQLWSKIREITLHRDATAFPDSDEGRGCLAAWGFSEADGMWTWRRGHQATAKRPSSG